MKRLLLVCIASSVWLLLVAATVASAASTLPVPTGKKTFTVSAVEAPQIGNDPANIIPIGIGPFAGNFDTIDIKVGLAPFAAAVDLYFVVYIPDLDQAFIYYTGDHAEPFSLVPTAWKKNVTGSVSEALNDLSNISSSQLPETTYYLGLVAVPAGSPASDPAAYYIWVTQFKVLTNGRTLTLASNCKQDIWVGAVGNNVGKKCASAEDCTGFQCKDTQCTDYACNSHADCSQPNSYCSDLYKSSKTACSGSASGCGNKQVCGPNSLCSWRSCTYVPLPVMASDIQEPQRTCSKNADCCSGAGCTTFCYITEGSSGRCAKVPPEGRGNNWHIAPGATKPQTLTMAVPTPWGGRIWPRTGCGYAGSACTDKWAGTDAQCGNGRTLTSASHPYASYCRQNQDCGPNPDNPTVDVGGKCVSMGTTGFPPQVSTKECEPTVPTSCDTKYPGKHYICADSATGDGTHGRCGFDKQCYAYQCSGLGQNLCDPKNFTCATGNCTDAAGKSSQGCATSGKDSPTVAELFMRSLADGPDYYDVSMVDGANVPVELSPDPDTYDMTTPDAVTNPKKVASCSTDADCIISNNDGTKDTSWVCSTRNDGTKGKCINRLVCGSPGCVSDCATYGFGLTEKSSWGGRDLAVTKDACPQSLELMVNGVYVGCLSPKDACSDGTAYQKTTLQCGTHIDGQDSYVEMFRCTGKNADTCYKAGASATCCGCPDWSFAKGVGCVNTNPYWTTKVGPAATTPEELYRVFHKASPSSYTFPFDDKNALFTCKGHPKDALNPNGVGVNYTITFCPK